MRLTWDAAMACRAGVVYILRDFPAPSSPWSCFPTWNRTQPLSPRSCVAMSRSFGARPADGPTPEDRCQQALQALNIGATGFRRRFLWATPPEAEFPFSTTGRPHPTVAPIPHCPVIRTQGANVPGSVADGRIKSPYPHPIRSIAVKPHRLHPYPRAPTTLTGSAPQDRRMRIHQPHGTKLTQEKLQ